MLKKLNALAALTIMSLTPGCSIAQSHTLTWNVESHDDACRRFQPQHAAPILGTCLQSAISPSATVPAPFLTT